MRLERQKMRHKDPNPETRSMLGGEEETGRVRARLGF